MWTPGDVRGQRQRIDDMENQALALKTRARILRDDLQEVCPHSAREVIHNIGGTSTERCPDCHKVHRVYPG